MNKNEDIFSLLFPEWLNHQCSLQQHSVVTLAARMHLATSFIARSFDRRVLELSTGRPTLSRSHALTFARNRTILDGLAGLGVHPNEQNNEDCRREVASVIRSLRRWYPHLPEVRELAQRSIVAVHCEACLPLDRRRWRTSNGREEVW